MSELKPAAVRVFNDAKIFARDFYRAMGNRDNNLQAVRQALITTAILYAALGLVALSQHIDR